MINIKNLYYFLKIFITHNRLTMKKLNQISIAILCIGGLFKHNSYPYANVLVSVGFFAVATTLIIMALKKEKQ